MCSFLSPSHTCKMTSEGEMQSWALSLTLWRRYFAPYLWGQLKLPSSFLHKVFMLLCAHLWVTHLSLCGPRVRSQPLCLLLSSSMQPLCRATFSAALVWATSMQCGVHETWICNTCLVTSVMLLQNSILEITFVSPGKEEKCTYPLSTAIMLICSLHLSTVRC